MNWFIFEDYKVFSEDTYWGIAGNLFLDFCEEMASIGESTIFDSL